MTLIRTKAGAYEGDFRAKGMPRLHLSLRTKTLSVAESRHGAVLKLIRQKRWAMIEQLRGGTLSLERLESMIEHHEPLVPLAAPVIVEAPTDPTEPTWETVDEASERYLEWMRNHPTRSKQTATIALFQLQRFRAYEYEGHRIGAMPLDRVPAKAILAYQRWMQKSEAPINTITTYMARLGGLWTWAVNDEAQTARDNRVTPRPLYSPVNRDMLVRETVRRDRILTIEEGNRLLAATPKPYLFTVACGLLAGLRIGEVLHLRPLLDVDVALGVIAIRKQTHWRPKTRRSVRVVPMADQLLAWAIDHTDSYASGAWMHPSPVVPGEPFTELGFRKHFMLAVERAGMVYGRDEPQGVTFHTLRHTFASHAVMSGVDLYTVAKLLGDRVQTVEDVYADLSPDYKRTAMAKLESAFTFGAVPADDTETAKT